MVQKREPQGLIDTWNALGSVEEKRNWSVIPVSKIGNIHLSLGIHFPGGEECLLMGVQNASHHTKLPTGEGFLVENIQNFPEDSGMTWYALMRRGGGEFDFFAQVVSDIIDFVDKLTHLSGSSAWQRILRRIDAWQDFMARGGTNSLSKEAVIGLFGEIIIIDELISSGIRPEVVIDAWCGPNRAAHDFMFCGNLIEVKTTVATGSVKVTISSLEQLDPLGEDRLNLAVVRLKLLQEGTTLPELIERVRQGIKPSGFAVEGFDNKILAAGYTDITASQHGGLRYWVESVHFIPIDNNFPRLTRAMIPREIVDISYTIDLSRYLGDVDVTEVARSILEDM